MEFVIESPKIWIGEPRAAWREEAKEKEIETREKNTNASKAQQRTHIYIQCKKDLLPKLNSIANDNDK